MLLCQLPRVGSQPECFMVLCEVGIVVRVVYNNNDLCLDLNFLVGSGSYDATMSSIGSFRF